MSQGQSRFRVPPIFRTLYKNWVTAPPQPTSTPRFPKPSQKTVMLAGYYLILAMSITFTAYTLKISGIATRIMDAARERTSSKYVQNKSLGDRSSIRLTSSSGMVMLLTDPQGRHAGETSDGLRFQEIDNVVISTNRLMNLDDILVHKSLSAWGLLLPNPTQGTYNLELSAIKPGNYQIAIFIADSQGIESHNSLATINFKSTERSRYIFDYYPDNPSGTKLIFKNIFYRENDDSV